MPPRGARPNNLGISRRMGTYVSILGCIIALVVIGVASVEAGMSDQTRPVVLAIIGTFGVILPGLIAALKATEAADTASRTHNVAQFTASQNSMLQQLLITHVAQLCPLPDCPLKQNREVT